MTVKLKVLVLFLGLLMLLTSVDGEQNCDYGTYGVQCDMNCSSNCGPLPGTSNVHCGKETGECYEGCIVGWYGLYCDLKCSRTCVNKTCNYQNGHCTHGCGEGKTGSFCEEALTTSDRPRTAAPTTAKPSLSGALIAGIAVIPIIVLVIVGIVIIILFKCRPDRSDRSETEPLVADPFHVACKSGDVQMVEHILSGSIGDIDRRGDGGKTPVMIAAEFGQEEVIKLLKRRGANLSVVGESNNNILHMACSGGHVETVRYILSQSIVDINSRGRGGLTPVMMAAEFGKEEVIKLLERRGANLSVVDKGNNNILHMACIGGHVETVRYILSLSIVGINSRGKGGLTPVMMAAEKGHRQVIDILVSEEADMKQLADGGNNILHVACLGGHVDIVTYLLSHADVEINSRGENNRTPVMAAAWHGHQEVVDFLLNKEADISQTDVDGNNILHLASRGGYVETVKVVLPHVDINSIGENGRTSAIWAAERGHIKVLKLLVSKRAALSLVDRHGNTVLHASCLGRHIEMVKYVLSLRPDDISAQGHKGRTPLLMAARQGHIQAVKFLTNKGAGQLVVDHNGNNVLHLACAGGHQDTVRYILKTNIVAINATNNDGSTAAMVAHRRGYNSICGRLACQECQM